MNAIAPAVLSMKDAAAYLAVSRWTLQVMARTYRIPFLYRGLGRNRKGFCRKDLDAWIEAHRVTGPRQAAELVDGRRRA